MQWVKTQDLWEKNGFALDLKMTEFSDWFGQLGNIKYIS